MATVFRHNVLMFRTDDQPLTDHVSFASGQIVGDAGALMEFPHEYYHMPIVVWHAMGAPQQVVVRVELTQ